MDDGQLYSFPPVIDGACRTLILGSMPGVESLRRRRYYAHPRNAFWPIMADLLNEPLADDYEERTAMLIRHRIALWDVVGSCMREGSLDQNIREAVPNDFGRLFDEYPRLTRIFCNGAKAFQLFNRYAEAPPGISCTRLPSTSPAHAVSFERKLEAWREVVRG